MDCFLGAYDDEEAAARSYDLAALKYWGQETILNFPVSFWFINFLISSRLYIFLLYYVHCSCPLMKKSSKKWTVNQKKNILDL